MRYAGIDVHQAMSSVCILDEHGKQERAFTVRGPWPKLIEHLRLEGAKGPLAVCYEASNGYGFLHDQFSKFAESVSVAHAGKLRLIFRSKRKNDRLDAERLAKVLFLGEVPEVYVPGHDVRAHRRLITFRTKEINTRTCIKNRLRGMLRRNGIVPEKSLWSRRGLAWLAALELDSPTALERDLLLEELGQAAARIKRVEKELNRIAKTQPGIALLCTIPGVGVRTAEAIVAWVDQPGRFARYNTIGAYFGLVPSQDASAGIERMGHITKQGPPVVRRLLIEAAWQAVRRSADFRARFEHHMRKDPDRRKIAIVAIAHELVRIMRAMLVSGRPYQAQLN